MTTMPVMTKYEFVALLSSRAQQIASGCRCNHIDNRAASPLNSALSELVAGVLPLKVHRVLPDGTEEVWASRDLAVPASLIEHARRIGAGYQGTAG